MIYQNDFQADSHFTKKLIPKTIIYNKVRFKTMKINLRLYLIQKVIFQNIFAS